MVCFILHMTLTKRLSILLFPSSREKSAHVGKKHNGQCREKSTEVSAQYKAYSS